MTSAPPPTARRRTRRARTEVVAVLVGLAVLSLTLTGIFNYVAARDLLSDTAEQHLIDIGISRKARIESAVGVITATVATLAADHGVTAALRDTAEGYAALDEQLSADQTAELTATYEEVLSRVIPPSVDPPAAADVLPSDERSRYLQYLYIVQNPAPEGELAELVDPGDGSAYSAAHATHHPEMRALRNALSLGDVLLIDARSQRVVYSVDKRLDFAVDLVGDRAGARGLANVLDDQLTTAAVNETVIVDFEPYGPAGFAPTMFVVAAIRDEGEVIGALAVEIPLAALNLVTTAGGDWEGTGLGDTGEIYIVGQDRTMRTDSRSFLEDPAQYVAEADRAGLDESVLEAIEFFGTTALLQPVDTEAVEAAAGGELFTGRTTNYLGVETVTVAAEIDTGGLDWVMVAESHAAETYAAVADYRRNALLFAAIAVPLVILAGVILTRRVLRPMGPISEATRQVGDGDFDIAAPEGHRDEFGELGSELNRIAATLRDQDSALAQANDDITELLLAVLPRRLAESVQRGESGIAETVRNATLVVGALDETPHLMRLDEDARVDIGVELSQRMAAVAKQVGIEHFQSSVMQQIYAAGLESADAEAAKAMEFVDAARKVVAEFADEHELDLTIRAGLAAGDVMAGVVGSDRLSLELWGMPVRVAAALAALAAPGQVLADESVAAAIGDVWPVARVDDLVDLDGNELPGWEVGARTAEASAAAPE